MPEVNKRKGVKYVNKHLIKEQEFWDYVNITDESKFNITSFLVTTTHLLYTKLKLIFLTLHYNQRLSSTNLYSLLRLINLS